MEIVYGNDKGSNCVIYFNREVKNSLVS
jgi:hypothetical protein